MKLVIGGFAQGKLNYVLQDSSLDAWVVLAGLAEEVVRVICGIGQKIK